MLWDSLRKCLDMIEQLQAIPSAKGWRKIKNIRKALKRLFRAASRVFKGKEEQKKKQLVKQYLHQAGVLEARAAELIQHPPIAIGKNKQ